MVRAAMGLAVLFPGQGTQVPGMGSAWRGHDAWAVEACRPAAGADRQCWIANDNAPGQVVVGGTPGGLDAACARARELGIRRVLALNVGGAFHTPLMASARDELDPELAAATFAAP